MALVTNLEGSVSTTAVSENTMSKRALTSSAVGNALEWFDFVLYGALSATILPALFFSSLDPLSGTLASFAAVGVGFVARPLGAIICGRLGDSVGRKRILIITVLMMGTASLLVGLLPTYQQIGIAAPIALVCLRIVQGFALGGESTGSQLMAIEYAPNDKRGLFGALVNMGSPISQTVANGLLLFLNFALTKEQFFSFGWRIPFLLSVLLVGIGLYIRLYLAETPSFRLIATGAQKQIPLSKAFGTYWPTMLRLFFVWLGPSACIYVIYIFSLNYMIRTLGFPQQTAFMIMTGGNLFGILMVFVGGTFSDRVGRRMAMLVGFVVAIAIALVYFTLLDTKSVPLVALAVTGYLGVLYFHFGIQPPYFAEPFPTGARYLGSAVSFSLSNMVSGGAMPIIAVYLVSAGDGSPKFLTALMVGLLALGFVMTWIGAETKNLTMNRETNS